MSFCLIGWLCSTSASVGIEGYSVRCSGWYDNRDFIAIVVFRQGGIESLDRYRSGSSRPGKSDGHLLVGILRYQKSGKTRRSNSYRPVCENLRSRFSKCIFARKCHDDIRVRRAVRYGRNRRNDCIVRPCRHHTSGQEVQAGHIKYRDRQHDYCRYPSHHHNLFCTKIPLKHSTEHIHICFSKNFY